ncbi:MAG: AAA domain-containing protein [Anaerovoracaceae bacterium]
MMHARDRQHPLERIELKGILSEFRDALEEEIDKIKKSGQSSTLLYSGRQIESGGSEFWYRFSVEYAPSLPSDTPCKLSIGKDQFDVTVVSFEENAIIISTKAPLPDTIGNARLENGATVLMERLIKCIEENADSENSAGKRMLPPEGGDYSAHQIFAYNDLMPNDSNTLSQNNAVKAALSNDITYIWGPPGTGKTTVIGQIIDELYKHERSVLVVSHTNTAVDGAIEKADKAYLATHSNADEDYPILRIGVPARPLPERVLLAHHVSLLGKELYEQKASLEKRQAELQHRINIILPLLAKDTWIRENMLGHIGEILQTVAKHQVRLGEIRDEIEEVNAAIQQEKTAHPEYSKYLVVSKKIKEKREYYDAVCEQAHKAEIELNELTFRVQHAQDEIKKHDIYAELRAQEAKFMSVPFLRNELAEISSFVTSLNDEITNLTKKQTAAQQAVSAYKKKSSVAKLFAGKNTVTQAQFILHDISIRLPQAKEEFQRQHNLGQEYNRQLESLLLLQEQIKAVVPSKTQEHWKKEVELLQFNLDAAQNNLPGLNSQKAAMYKEICDLEQQQNRAKASFDALSEYGRMLRKAHEHLETVKAAVCQENNRCSEQLERECSLCVAFFYNPTADGNALLFDKLSKLLASVKFEMVSVDTRSLKREKEEAGNQLVEIFRQLNDLKQRMQELEKQAIMSARIIGATLAKSYLNETLRKRKFDTVILDEASMASIPALWCASYLAESNIVIVGDFLQLRPIVMAETPMAQKWLGKDIFFHSGMQKRSRDKATCPDNFVMLNDQFRMESDIADIANMYYGEYGGLQSHDTAEFRVIERESFYKWYSEKRTKQNIHMIDTESLHAWVTGVPQGKSHSRLNFFSATVDVDLAFKFLENKLNQLNPVTAEPVKEASVLIVAPYKPHILRINQLIDLEYHNRGFKENLNYIRAGTIHSFQGSEADIVIFDLVIDEPHWKANLFMTDKEVNEDLRKMFNVAISRAKFKLYIVGNFAYCQKRAKNNALSELLDKLLRKDHLTKIDAKELIPNIIFSRQTEFSYDRKLTEKHIVCREESFNDYFMTDICSFKKRLIVYSPFMTEARLSILLPAFTDAINAGKQIVVVTKALSDRGKAELAQCQKCEKELRDIGVDILHKKGMHEKLVFVDNEAVWIGSLNALSFTGLTGEVMQRHADRELTAEYEKLFDIEHLCGAIENAYEQKCPICGGEMQVKESDEGGIYWQCVEGDYSRNAAQQYPVDGILRCKCGAPYVFAMKTEPRWVCSKDPRHYQKMRESDLKLEKMAAMIPTKTDRKEVDRFFAQKRKELDASNNGTSKIKKAASSTATENALNTKCADQLRLF